MLQLRPSEELTLSQRGYNVSKKIGEGSYAQVFLAEFRSSTSDDKTRNLACKIVDIGKAPKDFVKKFLPRELDILVRLNHPHIIHIHSIFQRKNKYFIFMRHAENGDLLEFILKKGPVSEAQSRVWVRQIALAIQYLHEMDVAHRDLKCENCLITNNYNIKLADFGFSRFVIDNHGRKTTSTTYCGSLSYAAPEVLRGMPYYPKISDIWSLGVIVFIMVNKAMPFDDTNVKRLYDHQINKRWKFRAKVADTLSDNLKSVVSKLLEPDVAKRWKIIQVLKSEWIAMDARLTVLSSVEEQALVQAQQEKKIYINSIVKKATPTLDKTALNEVKVFKANALTAERAIEEQSSLSLENPEKGGEQNESRSRKSANSEDIKKFPKKPTLITDITTDKTLASSGNGHRMSEL